MLGTKLELVTFVILMIEVIVLGSLVMHYLSRPYDKARYRFYKRLLNEIYDRTTKTFVIVPNTVNHMQMRNCLQTEAALIRLYNYDGSMVPFFLD